MLTMCYTYFNSLRKNKKGQGMVEYGLIISLISIGVIAALVILGPKIADMFNSVSGKIGGTATVAPTGTGG